MVSTGLVVAGALVGAGPHKQSNEERRNPNFTSNPSNKKKTNLSKIKFGQQ